MTRTVHAALTAQDVQTLVRGRVPRAVVARAQEKTATLAQHCGEPILSARVKLTRPAGAGPDRLSFAEANLNVNGRMVRAQAEGVSVQEALTELIERLRVRLDRTSRDWRSLHGKHRRNTIRTLLPAPGPAGRQAVIRRKYAEPDVVTPDQAIYDMELRDYDFYLFVDAATGHDSVVYRTGDGYRMARLKAAEPPVTHLPLTMSELPTPVLSLDEAVEHAASAGLPFLFYADAVTGRGAILYRRHDGGFGHISAVSDLMRW